MMVISEGWRANVEITVTDNDGSLSGDSWFNEYGNDLSGQFADIEIDGIITHDGVRIYAEQYQVVEDAKLEADGRPCRLELTTAASPEISGDSALLRRAIENIVRNAIRHTAPDTAVAVRLSGHDPVTVTIRDCGPGVPETDLLNLFEPFFRVEGARDRSSGGHGLGLAIAQQAIRAHGGEIVAVNAPDGGLQVEIRLPATA